MARRVRRRGTIKNHNKESQGKPSFPYTTKPGSLRKFLEGVPKRPKPTKINSGYLKGLGFRDANDQSVIRVLKAMGLVGENNVPTEKYTDFMKEGTGPGVLGTAIREVYARLFEQSHEPQKEPDSTLRNYFNIHSGGSAATMSVQIQTFKALCDYADLTGAVSGHVANSPDSTASNRAATGPARTPAGAPVLHIDLHIHLPENKSSRDYEYILQDIAKYLYGREIAARRDNDG